jgi:class 3 adenylate cyclase
MQTKSFVVNVLQPKFARYFENNRSAVGQDLRFSIGCGLDDGYIYAVRVGIRGTNDVAWVGRCTNTAAKLSNILAGPPYIGITHEVYKRLDSDRKTSSNGRDMWSVQQTGEFGGVSRNYRTSSWGWAIA